VAKASKTHRIAAIPGDGIGPEVVAQGLRVLRRAAELEGFAVSVDEFPFGAEHYLATGESLPADFLERARGYDALLLGAIGDPRIEVGLLERAIIAGLRFGLDLYVNLRPVRLYAEHLTPLKNKGPKDIDFVVVRENTEDVYAGIGGILRKGTPDEVAVQEMIFTRHGTERVIRYAFELARRRGGRRKLTLVDKANAIRAMDLWTRTFEEVGSEFPDVQRDHLYVDAAAMYMVKNPEWFDVVVVSNLFGDILTDLGAMITGGLGIAASGNLHPGQVSLFEPVHGSAPKFQGKGVASPIATILSVGLLLEHVGEAKAASRIESSVAALLRSGRIPSLATDSGISTAEFGDRVLEALEASPAVPA
jgi:3-isopropylmalate dehydrogenase